MIRRGRHYRIVRAEHGATTTHLELEPVGRPLGQKAGQFAFIKIDVPGLSEPHPFTIASSPENPNLEFMVRHLGDWSSRLPDAELEGASVMVEGPFGEFAAFSHDPDKRSLWIAGGVGITPFLAALDTAPSGGPVPTLFYAVRETAGNMMLDQVQRAADEGRVRLELFTPSTGRMDPSAIDRVFPDGLHDVHVALCGPAGLVSTMANAAQSRGAHAVETEDFDIRQGFGPDRSQEIADALEEISQSRQRTHNAS